MPLDPWSLLGLVAFSVAATLVTEWLAGRLMQPDGQPARSPASVAATMVWIVLLFFAGLIAMRYIERTTNRLLGYLGFALAALSLSLVRAWLYQRSLQPGAPRLSLGTQVFSTRIAKTLVYPLFAFDIYGVLCLLLRRPVDLLLAIPLTIGALLPDLDAWAWATERLGPLVSKRMGGQFEPQGAWHSLPAAAFVALISTPLIPVAGAWAWALLSLGFLAHLVVDLANPDGVMLLWPMTGTRYRVSGPVIKALCEAGDRKQALALAALAVILLLAVGIGPAPSPPAPVPSYEQTVERYYAMRGRNLAIADVEGTWQATGRRVTDRFEILNARDQSFFLLDRYTGRVFTAGRTGSDDLYLNRISLGSGPPVVVKATEIQLKDEALGETLPLIYEMQREPGLQHIYISGDVVLPLPPDDGGPVLPVDLSQSGLRRIELQEPGHYSLRYLTAAELISLANVVVEQADLIIVATYITPPEGPTATPLPSPPAAGTRQRTP